MPRRELYLIGGSGARGRLRGPWCGRALRGMPGVMRRLDLPLLLVLLSVPTAAEAVTGYVCVRNDGVGTFDNSDLSLFAQCTPASGNRTDSGPGSALAPGGVSCMAMTGLTAWNGFQYEYVFEIDFMDRTGVVTVSSPSGLQLGAGSNYITTNGVSTTSGSTLDYLSLVNQAPPAYTTLSAYPNFGNEDTECYVYWSGVTSGQVQDWGHNELQRATSASGPWTTVYPSTPGDPRTARTPGSPPGRRTTTGSTPWMSTGP